MSRSRNLLITTFFSFGNELNNTMVMKRIKNGRMIVLLILLLRVTGCTSNSNIDVGYLTCENLKNPLGLNTCTLALVGRISLLITERSKLLIRYWLQKISKI